MKPPGPILVSKKPTTWKCVACPETFILTASKEDIEEKMSQLEADYDKHFKECHSEVASQAAARIVREATGQ